VSPLLFSSVQDNPPGLFEHLAQKIREKPCSFYPPGKQRHGGSITLSDSALAQLQGYRQVSTQLTLITAAGDTCSLEFTVQLICGFLSVFDGEARRQECHRQIECVSVLRTQHVVQLEQGLPKDGQETLSLYPW